MASYMDECLWAIRFGTPPPAALILMLARSEKLPARRYCYPLMRRQSAGLLRAGRDTEESFGSPPLNGSLRRFSFCQNNEDIPVRPQPKRAASTRPRNRSESFRVDIDCACFFANGFHK